jgi:DNA processing protein
MAGEACDLCTARAALLQSLSPLIELVATREPGSRVRELLGLEDAELTRALTRGKSARLERNRAPTTDEVRSRLNESKLWSTCRHRDDYPARLHDLGTQAPAALFGRGDRGLLERVQQELAVSVVGSRRASAYGLTTASALAGSLAGAQVIVISGLAHGVDSAAHEGALSSEGSTIAVLGAGAERCYPRGQWRLYERIAATGLVISELPPESRPYRWTFPARNRIMAALAQLTVVVEAALRSGSLITAEMALDLGREVGAVPGPVSSARHQGANALLADGARFIRGGQDVLDVLCGPGERQLVEHGPELSAGAASVLSRLEAGDSPDAIAVVLTTPAAKIATALAQIERLGYVESDPAGRYRRTALRTPPPPS